MLLHWEVFPAGARLGLRGAGVLGRSGFACKIQWVLACLIPLGDGLVCKVGHRLRRHSKIGGTVDVPHGEGEVESHHMCVAGGLLGDEEGDSWDVPHPHP